MLKYRRTSALFLAVGVPVAINLLFLLIYALTPRLQQMPLEGRWQMFLQGGMSTWTQLFLPLGLGIIAALALNLEHGDNQWKHILVLGPSRVAVYLAKSLAVMSLVLLGSVALGVSALMIGGAVTGFQSIPWSELARGPALTLTGALGIVAVQTWLATRFKAFGSSSGWRCSARLSAGWQSTLKRTGSSCRGHTPRARTVCRLRTTNWRCCCPSRWRWL
ncbi:MAG: ABC transporter permease subunit [Pleurocapsa sp. SU_196_0]|nr:ABC transporter permease subunit [Pleurocapsa sp. SU_196_0]